MLGCHCGGIGGNFAEVILGAQKCMRTTVKLNLRFLAVWCGEFETLHLFTKAWNKTNKTCVLSLAHRLLES